MKCDVAAIWNAHKKYMESFIRKRVKDEELAKDLLQEVLLKMCEFCRKSNDVKNVKNWLFSITRNVMVDHFRKERKKEEISAISEYAVLTEDNLNEIASAFILPMIDQLPEKYRIPLMWSDIEQIPQTEIARKLNMSFSGAKSRVQRARKQLRELFYECCYMELDLYGNVIDYKPKTTCPLLANTEVS